MSKIKGIINTAEPEIKGVITSGPNITTVMNNGARGKSAYEIWLEEGNVGTKEEFLESLKAVSSDYEALINKPSIGEVELIGDKTLEDLGAVSINEKEIKNLLS